MQSAWNQLEQSTHIVNDLEDTKNFATKRDQLRPIQNLMALTSDFESIHAALLQQVPLPTLEFAVSQLFSHETLVHTLSPQRPDVVLGTLAHSSKPFLSQNGLIYYKYIRKQGHLLPACSTITCIYCHKTSHILLNCSTSMTDKPRTVQSQPISQGLLIILLLLLLRNPHQMPISIPLWLVIFRPWSI